MAMFVTTLSRSLLNKEVIKASRCLSTFKNIDGALTKKLKIRNSHSPIILKSKAPFFTTQKCHYATRMPRNTIIMFVPQQEAWVIERMGKYLKILEPGLNILIPILDEVKYIQVLKEQAIKIPEQSAVTKDNVILHIDGVLYIKVHDPYKSSYGIEDPEYAITQLAQTTMRSEIGKLSLDGIFRERETLNENIVTAINNASFDQWGIACLRYEIRDIQVPSRVQEAMQMQVEAERKKRAAILESEGRMEADINVAQGERQAQILASEAEKMERINKAEGEARGILATANARAEAIQKVAVSLSEMNGSNAASLAIAEQYVQAFSKLAKETNTVILPSNVGDTSSMITQAMTIYKTLHNPDSSHVSKSTSDFADFEPIMPTAASELHEVVVDSKKDDENFGDKKN